MPRNECLKHNKLFTLNDDEMQRLSHFNLDSLNAKKFNKLDLNGVFDCKSKKKCDILYKILKDVQSVKLSFDKLHYTTIGSKNVVKLYHLYLISFKPWSDMYGSNVNNSEDFLKIGVSSNYKNRFNKNCPYHTKLRRVCHLSNKNSAERLEKAILVSDILHSAVIKYYPLQKFPGYTECFKYHQYSFTNGRNRLYNLFFILNAFTEKW